MAPRLSLVSPKVFFSILSPMEFWFLAAVASGLLSWGHLISSNIVDLIEQKLFEHASDLPASAKAAVELCCPEYFGSDARSGRRVCALCKLSGLKVKTSVYCTKCSVPLCLVASRNCFRKWHTDGHSQIV